LGIAFSIVSFVDQIETYPREKYMKFDQVITYILKQ